MNTETIRARVQAVAVTGCPYALRAEAAALRAELDAWKVRRDAAWEVLASAREFSLPTKNGFETVTKAEWWQFPAVDAASKAYDTIADDDRYYWIQARLDDIGRRLGTEHNPQATFGFVWEQSWKVAA